MKLKQSFSVRLSLRFMFLLTLTVVLLSFGVLFFVRYLINFSQTVELKNAEEKVFNASASTESDLSDIPYYITYLVYDETKHVIATNDPFLPLLRETHGKAVRYFVKDYFFDGNLDIFYYAEKHKTEENEIIVAVVINMDNNSMAEVFSKLPVALLFMVIPLLVLCFFVSLFITKNTMNPVIKITKTASSMTTENLDSLLPLSGRGDEIDELSEAFNDLFRRIKIDFDRERQFSSDVSHELNTPLTVITGQANLLLRWGKDNPEQLEKSLNAIKNESKSMHAIIENLLQISRVESGRIKPEFIELKTEDLFNRIQEEFSAVHQNVQFEINCEEGLSVFSDEQMLYQILVALVSNSIKFFNAADKQGACLISLTARKDSQTQCVVIEESDNGPGISSEALPHIFERFYRADESHTRATGGSGLGLSIAQTLCSALGATISAENKESGGAVFRLQF